MNRKSRKYLNIFVNLILLFLIFHSVLFSYINKNVDVNKSNLIYFFFIIIIIFYIYLILTRKSIKFNLIIILIIYSSVYFFEIYLDTYGTTFKQKRLDKNFDTRSKFQVLSELQNNNNNIFPGTYFLIFLINFNH